MIKDVILVDLFLGRSVGTGTVVAEHDTEGDAVGGRGLIQDWRVLGRTHSVEGGSPESNQPRGRFLPKYSLGAPSAGDNPSF